MKNTVIFGLVVAAAPLFLSASMAEACTPAQAIALASRAAVSAANAELENDGPRYHVLGQPSGEQGGNYWDLTVDVTQGLGGKEYHVHVTGTPQTACSVESIEFVADLR